MPPLTKSKRMINVEVILRKDSKGRTVSSYRCRVDERVVRNKEKKVVKSRYGHVIVLDFMSGKAEFWMSGTTEDRKYSDIIFK